MVVRLGGAASLTPSPVFEVLVLGVGEDGLSWDFTESLQELVVDLALFEVHLEVVQVLERVFLILLLLELLEQETDGPVLVPEVQLVVDYVGAFAVHQERVAPVVVQSILVQGVLSVHLHTQLRGTTDFVDVTLRQLYLVAALHLQEHSLDLPLSLFLGLTPFLLVELHDALVCVLVSFLLGLSQVLHAGFE